LSSPVRKPKSCRTGYMQELIFSEDFYTDE
jgi:hypothetical protein